ncbi:MAG: site-specific integrase, partial [Pseudomonadota bacterium]|nr:site-specific integrase [Pseudomonadota bacterium]
MATIRKRNGRWQAQVRKSGTRAVSRTFTLRQDALFWAREQERVLELQTDVLEKKTLLKQTLAGLLHDYEVEVGQHLKSHDVELHYFNQLRRTQFAQLTLDRLKPADIQRWVNERSASHKASSTVRLLGVLSRAFNHAIKHHGFPLPFNPVERVIKPRIGQKTIRRIPSRLAKLLESPACKIGWIACFAVETAMRRSEIAKLEWADVDLERRLVHVKNTKNGHDRSVPLSSTALVALGQFKRSDKAVFGMSSNAIRLAWGRYRRSHGIDSVRYHDLRHEAISRLFERGLTTPEVALLSGHKTVSQLFRYAH